MKAIKKFPTVPSIILYSYFFRGFGLIPIYSYNFPWRRHNSPVKPKTVRQPDKNSSYSLVRSCETKYCLIEMQYIANGNIPHAAPWRRFPSVKFPHATRDFRWLEKVVYQNAKEKKRGRSGRVLPRLGDFGSRIRSEFRAPCLRQYRPAHCPLLPLVLSHPRQPLSRVN